MSGALRFRFDPDVSLTDAEATLHLAMFGVEGLVGRARVRASAKYYVGERSRAILVHGGDGVGRMIAHVFTGLLLRQIGEHQFQVEQIDSFSHSVPAEVTV